MDYFKLILYKGTLFGECQSKFYKIDMKDRKKNILDIDLTSCDIKSGNGSLPN